MRTPKFLFPLLVLVLASALPAQLSIFKMKNGKEQKGIIVEETSGSYKIETPDGKTIRINRADVDVVEETNKTGNDDLDKMLESIDRTDPDAMLKVATAAKEKKLSVWKALARSALKDAPDHEGLNLLLGHVKVGDRWYTDKKEGEEARAKAMAAEMKEKGYLRVDGGFIKKEDKAAWDKDKSKWMKDDDGIWRPKDEVMKSKGFILRKGQWIKLGSEEDQADAEKFKQLMGDDIWIQTSTHFRLFVQGFEPDVVAGFSKEVESTYEWFLTQMGKPKDFPLWGERKADLWVFKDIPTKNQWLKHYKNRYGMSDETASFFEKAHNFIGGMLGGITPDQGEDLRNQLVHISSHFMISAFSRGLKGTPQWLSEGWAHYAEHTRLGNGHVCCSTKSQYGGDGGKAEKKFTTKDAKDRCKGLVRQGAAPPFESLSKLGLNELSGDHLSKGYSVIDWLMTTQKEAFVAWLEGMNTADQQAALGDAFKGWTFGALDGEWGKMVKQKY